MIRISKDQSDAVNHQGHVVVTACPGSGKTRVLTTRATRGLTELESVRQRVVALTFTRRAADEIQTRLDQEDVDTSRLWAGTIHAFALEWILRPYSPYCDICRFGFSVADEFYTERLLDELRSAAGLSPYADVKTVIDRSGCTQNADSAATVCKHYRRSLREAKLIDYDEVLYLAYRILVDNHEIAATLGSIIRLVCVDEVQDIQDLQYGILSEIFKNSTTPPVLFFVGDANQSIYESLGALTKTPQEIAAEFGLEKIDHRELKGNYRSTQRIIDLYRQLRPGVPPIESLTEYASHVGEVTFDDQTVAYEQLPKVIASMIKFSIDSGVPDKDICVLAPRWQHVRPLARSLVAELPGVAFDAPGLSPLYSARDNFWYKLARLTLTEPSPPRTRTRMRWSKELMADLIGFSGVSITEEAATPRRFLRVINSISSPEQDGIAYLRDAFSQFCSRLCIGVDACPALENALATFFDKAASLIARSDGGMPTDVGSFRRFFSHPAGVVVNTCHGVKGEEFETVIACGLLRGHIPHWDVIMNAPEAVADDRESKLLYVICSRAKRRLHLIAESGRRTQRGRPYETSRLLTQVRFKYDVRH